MKQSYDGLIFQSAALLYGLHSTSDRVLNVQVIGVNIRYLQAEVVTTVTSTG